MYATRLYFEVFSHITSHPEGNSVTNKSLCIEFNFVTSEL